MSQIFLNINAIVSFLCLLIALHLFCQRSLFQLSVRLLAACFLTIGMQALFLILNISNYFQDITAALQPTMAVLFGPLAYLVFRSALYNRAKLTFFDLSHLIPAVAIFTLMLSQQTRHYADFVILSSMLLYTLLLTQMVWRKRQYLRTMSATSIKQIGNVREWIYIWLCVFMVYAWLILAGDFLIFFELDGGTALVQSFGLVITVLFKLLIITLFAFYALQKSPVFDWLYTPFNTPAEKALEDEKKKVFQKIIESFEEVVEDPAVYTQEVLSLKAMADKLCIPARTFSNAINYHYDESYAKRMNRLRIRFAQKLLSTQPELSIVVIMYESGFQTKSSFNKEFKAINGMSPSEFRQSAITLN